MKFIKSSFEILEQQPGLEGTLKHIERIGRVCYKSEDKITDDSYLRFFDMLKSKKHLSVLEHGTVYLKLDKICPINGYKYRDNKYSTYNVVRTAEKPKPKGDTYITTNFRVIVENGWESDLKYLCEPTEYHEKRYSVLFVCDRGVSHEFVRHRVFSFAQESTRYCNYSKDKFDNNCVFIIPSWLDIKEGYYAKDNIKKCIVEVDNKGEKIISTVAYYNWDDIVINTYLFIDSLCDSEYNYKKLCEKGWKPQQARQVLPNALKTELVMTGFAKDWEHFFSLRADKTAHPSAQELAHPLESEFFRRGYIK